jgi:single-strand DNA-binding protein
MDYNRVILVGRVGRDPETKKAGEKTLSSFSVATSYGTGDNARTAWHQVTAWEKLGEIAQQILHKGDRVLIEGRIDYNTVDKNGTKVTYTQITASNLINLQAKPVNGEVTKANIASASTTASAPVAPGDEDIPF